MSPQIADLASPLAQDSSKFGSKAATLARLTAEGFAVPVGLAISASAYLDALSREDMPSRESFADFRSWADAVHKVLAAAPVAEHILAAVASRLDTMCTAPWIVRSSAVGEDGATSSFAGQLDSISDVTHETLADAIARVWASAWGPRAVLYREHRGLTAIDDLPVCVLIQPFMEPELAGVAFTSSPLPDEDGMVVEAVQGRGELLVSGSAAPVRFLFDEYGQPVPDAGHAPFSVPTPLLRELWRTGQDLVSLLERPLDIEWLAVNGSLTVVQARPITAIAASAETRLADPDDFEVSVCIVEANERSSIPEDLADKDKFKLRLLASAAGVAIGRGWLITVRRRGSDVTAQDAAATIRSAATTIASQVERFQQVSMVLQNPGRLNGEILRQFTNLETIEQNLRLLIAKTGAQHDEFQFIATEIFQAHMSGISHLVEDQLVVEVAFGSYVPKGIVPTSLYVVNAEGAVSQHVEVKQETGVFIEGGAPHDRAVNDTAFLNQDQLGALRRMTKVVSDAYPDVSVEFGVLADGLCYLIDIIPDMSPVDVTDVRVMSPGSITGATHVTKSDDLAAESLDAHFHSERSANESRGASAIVVAPRPFLALEEHLATTGSDGVGFIFDQGSLLGHLAIILREHGVPAIVVNGATDTLAEGSLVAIDTTTDDLYAVLNPPTE